MIKAVIFDMDGVVVDSIPIWMESEFILLGKKLRHPPLDFETYKKEVRYPQYTLDLKRKYKLKERLENLKGEKWQIVFDFYNQGKLKLIPGFNGLIRHLKKQQLKTALGTSAPQQHLDWIARRFNFAQYFEFWLSSEQLKKHKPEPDVFLAVAKKLKVQPQECIVIEDSPGGILAGKRAGMRVIALKHLYSTKKDVERADKVVKSLREINIKLINNLSK